MEDETIKYPQLDTNIQALLMFCQLQQTKSAGSQLPELNTRPGMAYKK
jgi:hypothetical protein